MKIRYENTIDDVVAFNRFHCAHSRTVRRMRIFTMCCVAALGPLFAGAAALVTKDVWWLAAGALASVVGLILAPGKFQQHLDRHARKMYAEGTNKGLIGSHELELSDGELIARTPFGESHLRLEVIERVVSDGAHTFIYVSAVSGLAIRADAVTDGDLKAFVDALRRQLDARHAG